MAAPELISNGLLAFRTGETGRLDLHHLHLVGREWQESGLNPVIEQFAYRKTFFLILFSEAHPLDGTGIDEVKSWFPRMRQNLIPVDVSCGDVIEIGRDRRSQNRVAPCSPEGKPDGTDHSLIKGLVGNQKIQVRLQAPVLRLLKGLEEHPLRVFSDEWKPSDAD